MRYACIFMFMLIIGLCITSCAANNSEDRDKSISVKQFLFDHNYTLRIDGVEKDKYSTEFKCKKDSILELVQDGTIVSGMIIGHKDKWHKFPDTDVYTNLLSGG